MSGCSPHGCPPTGNPFYPLANPRGSDLKCEICARPAYLQCPDCRVTYYCGTEHQKIDWTAIHAKICSTVAYLRKPMTFIPTEELRRKKKDEILQTQYKMVKVTSTMGQKLLFEGKPDEAVPAALQCLKFTSDSYGLASVHLITPYLILAEASIYQNNLNQAEAYLAQAQWTMFKTQHECSNAIRSQVYRRLGLFFSVTGDYQAALESLAQDIYYSSCDFGPNHIKTAGGYFLMGKVFYMMYKKEKEQANHILEADQKDPNKCPTGLVCASATAQIPGSQACRPMPPALVIKDRIPPEVPVASNSPLYLSRIYPKPSILPKPTEKDRVADDLYGRVVDTWAGHLSGILTSMIRKPTLPKKCMSVVSEITQSKQKTLDELEIAEALSVLTAINTYRSQRVIRDGAEFVALAAGRPDPKSRLELALAMLYFLIGDKAKALQFKDDAGVSVSKAEVSDVLLTDMELVKDAIH